MKRRILLAVEYFPPHLGGGETLFGNMVRTLSARGHDVEVVTSAVEGAPASETWHGAAVHRIWTPLPGRRYTFMAAAFPTITKLARRADVVHTTTYNAAIPSWGAARAVGKPIVITVHEVWGPLWNNLPKMNPILGHAYRAFESTIFRLPFDAYICDSEATRRCLLAYTSASRERTHIAFPSIDYSFWSPGMHSAIDLRGELGLPPDTFVYLFFGRPGLSKGVEFLLDAAAEVHRARPDTRLVVLLSREPASLRAAALGQIKALGLSNHVIVRDPVEFRRLPGYLLAADRVVVPSLSEGFGYSAVEAATIGCRVIATTGHSVEEVLEGHAEFVPPRDSAALAATILRAAEGKGERLAPPPLRFTNDALVDVLENVYERVLTVQR